MKPIALIGMPGVGKSSVGQLLSLKLGLDYVDTDAEIEKAAGKSIPEIFSLEGESGFRKRESEALASALTKSAVISCGGGIVTVEKNIRALREKAVVVYLSADTDTLGERAKQADNRPLLSGDIRQKLETLYSQRAVFYEKCAHTEIKTDGKIINDIADEIVMRIQKWN